MVDSTRNLIAERSLSPTRVLTPSRRYKITTSDKLVVFGHSYVNNGNVTHSDYGFVNLLQYYLGLTTIRKGVGGTDVQISNPSNSNNSGLNRVQADVVNQNPKYVLIMFGINAFYSVVTAGTISHAQYQSDYTSILQTIRSAHPNVPIFCSGMPALPAYGELAIAPMNTDIQNAVNSVSKCYFISLYGLWNSDNFAVYLDKDNIHPNNDGHRFLAETFAAFMEPCLWNLT